MPDELTDRYDRADAARSIPIEVAAEPFDVTPQLDTQEPAPTQVPSRGRRVVLAALLAVGLAGATALGTTAWRLAAQNDATMTTPEQIDGLRRDDSERATVTADYLRTALAAEVQLDKVVGAVYAEQGATERSVLFFGGTTMLWTPERDLDTVLDLISDKTGTVTDVREVPAGALGGVMKCGRTATPDGAMGVCGWADHGSIAVGLFPGRGPDESAPVLRRIRDATQQRQ